MLYDPACNPSGYTQDRPEYNHVGYAQDSKLTNLNLTLTLTLTLTP